jgi:hypothetical protein
MIWQGLRRSKIERIRKHNSTSKNNTKEGDNEKMVKGKGKEKKEKL